MNPLVAKVPSAVVRFGHRGLAAVLVVIVCLGLFPGVGVVSPAVAAPDDAVAYLKMRVEQTRVPGASYCVLSLTAPEHCGGVGVDGANQPMTADTQGLWGSAGKSYLAAVVMKAVEGGKLALDRDVASYFAKGPDGLDEATAQSLGKVTIRELAQNSSGWAYDYSVVDKADAGRRAVDELDAISAQPQRFSPGSAYLYSDSNALVLTAVLEQVYGKTYEDILSQEILGPAGLRAITTAEQASTVPAGHRFVAGFPVAWRTPYDPAGAGYGYLGGSARDLASFGLATLRASTAGRGAGAGTSSTPGQQTPGAGTAGKPLPLSPQSITDMWARPSYATHQDSAWYGLGWAARTWDDLGAVYLHTGTVPGYSAALVVIPTLGVSVSVLQNVAGAFHGAMLTSTELGFARIVADRWPDSAPADSTYWPTVGASLVWFLTAIGAGVWVVRRLTQRRGLGSGALGVLLTCTALAWVGCVAVPPQTVGAGVVDIWPWAPDAAGLLMAATGAWIVVGLVALVVSVRSSRARNQQPV